MRPSCQHTSHAGGETAVSVRKRGIASTATVPTTSGRRKQTSGARSAANKRTPPNHAGWEKFRLIVSHDVNGTPRENVKEHRRLPSHSTRQHIKTPKDKNYGDVTEPHNGHSKDEFDKAMATSINS